MTSKLYWLGILGLTVAGCSDGGSGACANVKCNPGLTCEPTTGKCVGDGADAGGGGDMAKGGDMASAADKDMSMGGDDASTSDDAGMGDVNAVCKAPMMLVVNNNVATVTGDTTNLLNNTSSPNCGGDGADIAYVLGLNSPQLVDVTVTPDQSTPDYSPIVYIRSTCTDETGGGEVGCANGDVGVAAETSLVLKGGNYYIFVDGDLGSVGKYTLTVTLSQPPPVPKNDSCNMPEVLVFDNNGHATTSGDLRAANDDAMSTNCGGGMGPDAVYTFTINMTQVLSATVTPDQSTPNFSPILYVRKACADDATEVNCDFGTLPGTSLDAGTYFLWVDSDGNSPGKYTLDVDLGTPPMNDTCNAPTALTFVNNVATASFDTTNAANDTSSPNCGGTGPDVVYSMTLNAAQEVIAKIVPDQGSPNYQPVVYIRNACADETDMAEAQCSAASDVAMNAIATVPKLAAGTYFVWVDGYSDSFGKGTLTVTLKAPPPPPVNENCAMPTPIAKGAMAMGDTTGAIDDMGSMLSMTCDLYLQGNDPGPDVVYVYTAQATGMVTATLTTDGTWDPALWISPMMCTADGSTCDYASDNDGIGVDESIMFMATMGVSYYLVVDSYFPKGYGPFTLSIQ